MTLFDFLTCLILSTIFVILVRENFRDHTYFGKTEIFTTKRFQFLIFLSENSVTHKSGPIEYVLRSLQAIYEWLIYNFEQTPEFFVQP